MMRILPTPRARALALALPALLLPVAARAQLPAGFVKTTVAPGGSIKNGTSLAHAPDGRIFAAEIGGTVKVIQGGTVKAIHSVATNTDREQGLLKIEVHPKFAQNGWLYLYYITANRHHHNIDRIALDKDNKVVENKTIVELPPLVNEGRHNGSGLAFGKDGLLYVGRGEDEQSNWASQWTSARGKVLRFTDDGKPAPGNPHAGQGTAEEQSIYARGFRNPFSLTTDPSTGRIFEGEVGAGWEEINDVTQPDAAKDHWYGWGGGDGPNQAANTIKPLFAYQTGSLGCAITGVAAFNPPGSNWPDKWKNRVYFIDWCSTFIRGFDLGNPAAASEVLLSTGASKALGLSVGADGSLYYVEHFGGGVYRISNGTPSSLARDFRGAAPAASRALSRARAGARADLDFTVDGFRAAGPGRLRVSDASGRTVLERAVTLEASRFSVSGFETSEPGLLPYRVEWRENGKTFAAEGRLLVLP